MGAEIPSWAGQREGVGGAGISRGKLVRKAPVSKRVSGACDADSSRCLFFLLVRVVTQPPLPGVGEEEVPTSGHFLYKCEFPLWKECLCPVLRAFPESAGSQWPSIQNNPYAKHAHLGW